MPRERQLQPVRINVAGGIKSRGSAYSNQADAGVYDAENVSFLADGTVVPFPTLAAPGSSHEQIYDMQYDLESDTQLDVDTQGAATITSLGSDGSTIYGTSSTGANYERVIIRRAAASTNGWWENSDASAPWMLSTYARSNFRNFTTPYSTGATIAATANTDEYVVVTGLTRSVFRKGELISDPNLMPLNDFPVAIVDCKAVGGSSGYTLGTITASTMLLTQHIGRAVYNWTLTLSGTKGTSDVPHTNRTCIWDSWMTGTTLYVLYCDSAGGTAYLDQFTNVTSAGGSTTSTPTAKSAAASKTFTSPANIQGVALSRASSSNAIEGAVIYNDTTDNYCKYFVSTSNLAAALTTDIDAVITGYTLATVGTMNVCTVANGTVAANATTFDGTSDTASQVMKDCRVCVFQVSGGSFVMPGVYHNMFLASHLTTNLTLAMGFASQLNPCIALFNLTSGPDNDEDDVNGILLPRNLGLISRGQEAGYISSPTVQNGTGFRWMYDGVISSLPELLNASGASSKLPNFLYPVVYSGPQEADLSSSTVRFSQSVEIRRLEQVCVQASKVSAGSVLNSGTMFTSHVDTVNCVSFVPPEVTAAAGSGGSLAAGTYSARVAAVVEHNGHESYVSSPTVTATVSGTQKFNLTIRFPQALTDVKRLVVYRTLVNPAANTQDFYLEQIIDLEQYVDYPDVGEPTITVAADSADTAISGNALDPTLGGFSAPVEQPEGVFAVCEAGNRTWFANESFLIPCLPRTGRQLPQPTAAFAVRIPSDTGRVTALAELNGSPVVFTEKAVYGIAGEGPDYTGASSSLSPYLIHLGNGAIGPSAVATCPVGILFADSGGIYLLDSGRQVQRIGLDIQRFFTGVDESSIASRVSVAMDVNYVRNEVYIQHSGYLFIFNYLVGSWSRSTLVGHPAVIRMGQLAGEMRFGSYATSATYTYTLTCSFTTNALSFPDPTIISSIQKVFVEGHFNSLGDLGSSSGLRLSGYTRGNVAIGSAQTIPLTAAPQAQRMFSYAYPRQGAVKLKVDWQPLTAANVLTDFILHVDLDIVESNTFLK